MQVTASAHLAAKRVTAPNGKGLVLRQSTRRYSTKAVPKPQASEAVYVPCATSALLSPSGSCP